jgi:transposase
LGEYSKDERKKALPLYLEGLRYRSIGRYWGVGNVTVLKWIRSFGERSSPYKGKQRNWLNGMKCIIMSVHNLHEESRTVLEHSTKNSGE